MMKVAFLVLMCFGQRSSSIRVGQDQANSTISSSGMKDSVTVLNWNLCWECLSGQAKFGSGRTVGRHCKKVAGGKTLSNQNAVAPGDWTQCTENMLTMMAEWNKEQKFGLAFFQEGLTSLNWVPYFQMRLADALPGLKFVFLQADDRSGNPKAMASTSMVTGYSSDMGPPDAVFAINLSPGVDEGGTCSHGMDIRPALGLVWKGQKVVVNIHNGRCKKGTSADDAWKYLMGRVQLAYKQCDEPSSTNQTDYFMVDEKAPRCWFPNEGQEQFSVEEEILKGSTPIILAGDSNNADFKATVGETSKAKTTETEIVGKAFKGQKDITQQKTCCVDKLETKAKSKFSSTSSEGYKVVAGDSADEYWQKSNIGSEADKEAGIRVGDFVFSTHIAPRYLISGSSAEAEYLYDRPATNTAMTMVELDPSLSQGDPFFMSDHDPTIVKLGEL
jgi:hypothetical protein